MVTLLTIAAWLTLAYFWLKGHWFAAIIATPVSAAAAAVIYDHHVHSQQDALLELAVGAAIAWVPWVLRRLMQRKPATAAAAPDSWVLAYQPQPPHQNMTSLQICAEESRQRAEQSGRARIEPFVL